MVRHPLSLAALSLLGLLSLGEITAGPAQAAPLPVSLDNPHLTLAHGWGRGPSISLGFGFYAPAPVPVYPAYPAYPPPRVRYYEPAPTPDPYWLDRHARWARPNHRGGMDYQLHDGRFCRTWREPYGSLAVSCD